MRIVFVLLLVELIFVSSSFAIKTDLDVVKNNLEIQYQELKLLADNGSSNEQYELFLLVFQNENILSEKIGESVFYLKKAAHSQHSLSMFLLGALYQTGTMIDIDRDKALKWLLLASREGIVDAQVMTANNYALRFSKSVDKNNKQIIFKKAEYWYSKAISQGSIQAKWQYGELLLYIDNMSTEGLKLLNQAAELGDAKAMHALGVNYDYLWRKFKKIENYDSARLWYQKSVDAGYKKSNLYLEKLRQLRKHNKPFKQDK